MGLQKSIVAFIILSLMLWNAQCVSQQWKDANNIMVYKRNENKADCGKQSGISLLVVVAKVHASIRLQRLQTILLYFLLPDTM